MNQLVIVIIAAVVVVVGIVLALASDRDSNQPFAPTVEDIRLQAILRAQSVRQHEQASLDALRQSTRQAMTDMARAAGGTGATSSHHTDQPPWRW